MFTFHALSSGLSPGFVSLCPFPNRESSILSTNPSIARPQKQPGVCVYPLHCIPAFTKGHRRLLEKPTAWGSICNHNPVFAKIPGYHRQSLIFFPEALFLLFHLPSPSSKGQWTWDSPTVREPFPSGLQHPLPAKKETTKLENKPTITTTTTETPRKPVGKP